MKDGKPQTHINTWPYDVYFVRPLANENNRVLLWVRGRLTPADINGGTDIPTALNAGGVYSGGDFLVDKDGHLKLEITTKEDGDRHYSWCDGDGSSCHEFMVLKKDDIIQKNETFNPVLVGDDDQKFLVLSNIDRDTVGLFEYDPLAKKFTKTLFAKDDADVTECNYDWKTNQITAVVYSLGGVSHYESLDPKAAALASVLRNAFPGEEVSPYDMSHDGREVLLYVSSSRNSGAYYALDMKAGNAEFLGQHTPWFDEDKMAPTAVATLNTTDGFSVSYLLTLPRMGNKPYPLVVIPHGGPIGVFDWNGFDNESQLLASRGYAVLKVNYRGSGGGGMKFENAGKRQWGRKIEDDIEAAVKAALKGNPIDSNRVCIYGASYGGYSALMSLIRDPQLYKCAASFAGVTDLTLLYDTTHVQFSEVIKEEIADIIGDPTDKDSELETYSPVYLADKIARPVLIGQGLKDDRVDPEHAYRLKLMLDTFKKTYEFYTYDDEAHGFYERMDAIDFYTHLLGFLDKNIGDSAATDSKTATTH